MYFYSLNTNPNLEKAVQNFLKLTPGQVEEKVFNNGEYYVRLKQEVKKKKVVVMASITDLETQIFRLLFLANALKSNGAAKITLVLPYFPYSRQDRVTRSGEPVSSELMASLYPTSGFSKVLTIDIHNLKGLGKWKKYVKNLDSCEAVSQALKNHIDSSWNIVAPDFGAKKRADRLAKALKIKNIAYLTKERPEPGKARILTIGGAPVSNKKVLIIDDMIDTGGTLIKAANFLHEKGAKQVMAACTHGIFSSDAIKRINESVIKKVFVCDSLPLDQKNSGKLEIISCANLIAQALKKYV